MNIGEKSDSYRRSQSERRAEFAMEENRLFDLKRTGRAAGTIKGFVSPKHDYYPVPANQLQLNTALSQRAGW